MNKLSGVGGIRQKTLLIMVDRIIFFVFPVEEKTKVMPVLKKDK